VTWNVKTIVGKEVNITKEMERYKNKVLGKKKEVGDEARKRLCTEILGS
jgi:hypothetical protein